MATQTTNLGLTKPAGTDYVLVSDFNTNADTLDGAIGDLDALQTTEKGSLVGAINDTLDSVSTTVNVGTTTTGAAGTNASVTNSGTDKDAVFNFTIPRGENGLSGTIDGTTATTFTGLLKGNGSNISAATADTDYASAARGLPTGGTTGQALVKSSATNYAVGWASVGVPNIIINGNFGVNQRAKSGTVTLAAGAYGHDRWKAGAGGCTYTFATSENTTTITISAGSLIQVVEGVNLQSGTVCLSWTGTAQGKIGAGSYSVSGVTGTATGGTNLSIEFNTGTLSKVHLNYGPVALPYVPRGYAEELRLCQRYYLPITEASVLSGTHYVGAPATQVFVSTPAPMRGTPTFIGGNLGILYLPSSLIVPTSVVYTSLKSSGVIVNLSETSMTSLGSFCATWQAGSDNALDSEI